MTQNVNLFLLESEKQIKILDAALEVFLRYGFKKTTMGDIASKAGISRPAVYLEFCNKEKIFRAVISRKMTLFFEEAQMKSDQCTGIAERIAAVLDCWILEPYRMISSSEESEDLLGWVYSFASDLQKEMLKMLEGQIAAIIRSDPETNEAALAKTGLSIDIVARLIAISTADLKHTVTGVEELEQLLEALVKVYTALITGGCCGKS